ncbi:MAG: hypothetical protein ACREV9_15875 [Burkholderiales bacterium]
MSSVDRFFLVLTLPRLLFALLVVVLLSTAGLWDLDYFWHLKTGEYIVTHLALPRSDIFSYTNYGVPWVPHEWLFQAVLYLVHNAFGSSGVKLLTVLLASSALFIAYSTAKKVLNSTGPVILLTFVAFIPIAAGMAPRPQLITYVFFAAFLHVIVDFKYHQNARRLWLLPMLMVFWVNFHGGYIVGLFLLFLFLASELVVYWFERPDHQRQMLWRLGAWAALTVLASLANPDFIMHWLYPFNVAGMETAINTIQEWRSPDFHLLQYQYYLLMAMGFFAILIYRKSKPDLTELLLPSIFLFAGFVSLRHIPLAGLALVPFAAAAIKDGLNIQGASRNGVLLARFTQRALASRRVSREIEARLNWAILVAVVLMAVAYQPEREAREIKKANSLLPVNATNFIEQTGITGRMFNSYNHGGYLIYRLYPRQQVFIDGRADVYGDEFLKSYMAIVYGEPGWEKAFDGYKIDYVICHRDSPLRQLLLLRGDYKLVYDDDKSSVLLKDAPGYAQVIAKYGL